MKSVTLCLLLCVWFALATTARADNAQRELLTREFRTANLLFPQMNMFIRLRLVLLDRYPIDELLPDVGVGVIH